jgi:hypothetical protein
MGVLWRKPLAASVVLLLAVVAALSGVGGAAGVLAGTSLYVFLQKHAARGAAHFHGQSFAVCFKSQPPPDPLEKTVCLHLLAMLRPSIGDAVSWNKRPTRWKSILRLRLMMARVS